MASVEFQELFPDLPPEVRDIASAVQALILQLFPAAEITHDQQNVGYGYGRGYRGLVFTVSPYARHVNLGIARGAPLPDLMQQALEAAEACHT
jgi:hypothetical protein